MPSPSEKNQNQLKGYGAIPIVNASTDLIEDPNESWVQAYIVQQPKLQDIETHDDFRRDSNPFMISEYRDVPYAILYLVHLAIFAIAAIAYGSFKFDVNGMADQNGVQEAGTPPDISVSNATIVSIVALILASSLIPFYLIATIIPKYTKASVTMSLYFSVFCNIALAIMLFLAIPTWWMFLIVGGLVAYSIWYIFALREFIPYAAAVLKIAAKGVSANWGVYLVSAITSVSSVIWVVLWVYVANGVGLLDDLANSSSDYYYDSSGDIKISMKAFFLLVSLYWTSIILMNINQTTVAGMIGTYCFEKPSTSACSSTVTRSLQRSCTTSFGSICFGSLLNAIVTALRALADSARNNNDENGGAMLLYCVVQCILSILEDIIEYFNQWSYCFVGIYGMSYLESGKAVMELFHARGCTAILTNSLSLYVLNSIVLLTGVLCGGVGSLAVSKSSDHDSWVVFWICFVAGAILASTLTSTVQAAVKGVMICYFDFPGKMHENHPNDTKELSAAIALLYPEVQKFEFAEVV